MDPQLNVLGEELDVCSLEPLTGFYRDGYCNTGPEDLGSHTVCAVVTAEFLDHQRLIGNDLSTPMPQYGFPGLQPGDRWGVCAGAGCSRTRPVSGRRSCCVRRTPRRWRPCHSTCSASARPTHPTTWQSCSTDGRPP